MDITPASIEIGGELPRSLVQKFLTCINDEGLKIRVHQPPDEVKPVTQELLTAHGVTAVFLSSHEATNGEFFNLEHFCFDNQLSYVRTSSSGFDSESEIVFWFPGMEEPRRLSANMDGYTVVSVEELKQCHKDGMDLSDVIEHYTAPDVPMFTIAEN